MHGVRLGEALERSVAGPYCKNTAHEHLVKVGDQTRSTDVLPPSKNYTITCLAAWSDTLIHCNVFDCFQDLVVIFPIRSIATDLWEWGPAAPRPQYASVTDRSSKQ